MVDNVIMPEHKELDTSVPTMGSMPPRRGIPVGGYIGKWHCSQSPTPDMTEYGFADWEGNDRHFMGWAGTGVHFDPIIASNAAHVAVGQRQRTRPGRRPAVVSHGRAREPARRDVVPDRPAGYAGPRIPRMWPRTRGSWRARALEGRRRSPRLRPDYDEVCDKLPANFGDDLLDKPDAQRQWRWDQQHGLWGYIDPADTKAWLRHLDYYVELQRLADESLGTVLEALEDSGEWDDTVVIFTSDHGDMCGSHGLRSKGPFVYDEIMRVPLYIRVPGVTTAGSTTRPWRPTSTWRPRSAALAGVDPGATADTGGGVGLQGVDFSPVLADPTTSVRDHVLFAQDSAQTRTLNQVRYALRGFFDGETKYARYYGVGGGKPSTGLWGKDPGHKLFDVDCDFDDQDHEWYDHGTDPHELVNLANDRARRTELRGLFERLREYEAKELVPAP